MKSKQIVLASRPHGLPSSENSRFEERETNNKRRILINNTLCTIRKKVSQ